MAKLTDITELSNNLEDDDLIHVVDIKDNSQDAAGSSFKLRLITLCNFFITKLNFSLAYVLSYDNSTGGTNILVETADAIELKNGSLLKEGTYDFGGSKGISKICSVGYEDNWQSGIRHVFDNNGFIRESSNCFNIIPDNTFDNTLRFKVDSRWVLDNGDVYVCEVATTGAAVWSLIPSQVNADWNATSGVAEILNKPSIPAAQIQSDWNQTNNASLDYIKNKPTVGTVSPLTTKGDLFTYNSTNARLPVGLDTQILIADSTQTTGLKWGSNTAATPTGYYLSISDSTTQTNPTANTPRAVKFNSTDLANGFSLQTQTVVFTGTINNGGAGAGTILNVTGVTSGTLKVGMVLTGGSITAGTFISAFTSGTGGIGTYVVSVSQNRASATYTGTMTSQIVCANTGIYNLQFSSQMDKSDAGVDNVNFWLRKNGVDIPYSAGNLSLQGASPAYMMPAWNYVLSLVAGDIIELYWGSADENMSIYSEVAQTSPYAHPAIQSTILTVTQQSGIMAGTGLTAINSLTGAAQTLTTGTTGTDFAIVDSGVDHKFNLPTASATNRGALSSTDWSTFNGKQNALGYTPVTNARTITINGVTYDLTADRTWTISTTANTSINLFNYYNFI